MQHKKEDGGGEISEGNKGRKRKKKISTGLKLKPQKIRAMSLFKLFNLQCEINNFSELRPDLLLLARLILL